MTPAGTSNELDVQNGWEENTHTHSATAVVGKLFSDVGTPRVSFVLPLGSALLLSSSFLSGCNKDVLFNLNESSLTEPGLSKDASDFWKL